MNGVADVRTSLKNVVRAHLGDAASSLFIEKALSIIDESADSKESFMAASVRISKRIELFIDKDRAQKVYDGLLSSIEKTASYQGTRRRYTRVAFGQKVLVQHEGKRHELYAKDLSEGGVFITTDSPLPEQSTVEIVLPLGFGRNVPIAGVVVNRRTPLDCGNSKCSPGMGVQFKDIDNAAARMLNECIRKLQL